MQIVVSTMQKWPFIQEILFFYFIKFVDCHLYAKTEQDTFINPEAGRPVVLYI